MNENFATKEDVTGLVHQIEKMELRLTIKFGLMQVGLISILKLFQLINL